MAKWIITDVDGCLTPEESVSWDMKLFAQFARLSRQASEGKSEIAPMTLCTGRPQPYVEALMKLLDIRTTAICENGALLYSLHDNRARYAPGVTSERIRGLRAVREFIEADILPNCPAAVIQAGKEAQLSVFSHRPEIFAEVRARIEQFIQQRALPEMAITMSHYYLNISLAGVDKGAALKLLLEELGAQTSEVVGIGDTEGDLPLRRTVGFFACPSNATPAIKAVADYVSPRPALEGVLDILQRTEMRRHGC